MTLKQYAQKMRAAADAIEELLGAGTSVVNENPKVASAIRRDIRKARKVQGYHGKHWTQTRKGRARLSRQSKLSWASGKRKMARRPA
jgi:hypothetical protein